MSRPYIVTAALRFRCVVGMLWATEDRDGPIVSMEFYKYMFRQPGNTTADLLTDALNVAIRVMRKNSVPLERWIMFVHIGA